MSRLLSLSAGLGGLVHATLEGLFGDERKRGQ